MKQFKSILVLLAGVLMATPGAFAQNLLTNGDFENSAVNPGNGAAFLGSWNEFWNFGAGGQDLINTDAPSSLQNWGLEVLTPFAGTRSAKNFFDGGIWQGVSVTGSQQYTFDIAMFVPTGGGPTTQWGTFGQVRWLAADSTELALNVLDGDAATRNQWNTFHQILTAPAGAVTARIEIGTFQSGTTPANPTRFDDVSFQLGAIPEPSTYGMLALGLGMMIPVIRRRIKA